MYPACDMTTKLLSLAFVFVAASIVSAQAENYPSRPITIVVPTTAGGPPDTIARILGERMKSMLGQPIIVENVTGAGGTIGIARVVRAEPDGYTVSIGHLNTHVFSGATYPLSFDFAQRPGAGRAVDDFSQGAHRQE
jgi:tripartite-type tricarboxylate transporter receptor subunit TctC